MKAAKGNRHGHRDAMMVLVAYRRGLRASELVDLPWAQVELATATLHVRRVKQGNERRALRRLQHEQETIAIDGKRHGNKHRFITRFRSGHPNSIRPEF